MSQRPYRVPQAQRNRYLWHSLITILQKFYIPWLSNNHSPIFPCSPSECDGPRISCCNKQRVYQQPHHLWTLSSSISKLTTLHLTLQCRGKGLIKALKCMQPLEKLILCIGYPSTPWEHLLKSLAGFIHEPTSATFAKLSRGVDHLPGHTSFGSSLCKLGCIQGRNWD
jgi:hypothetical protein